MMSAEMLSYSRSRRSCLPASRCRARRFVRMESTNKELYGREATNREILTGDFTTPEAARRFEHALHRESAEHSR